jgi:hypothetical protein
MPIADYGVQLWWGKRKDTLLKEYKTIQNAALRHILGAYQGSPTKAVEIEASILPIELRARLVNNQALDKRLLDQLDNIKPSQIKL